MIVTIHQPNFLPWLGFFDKIRQADLFILLDCVHFEKGGYQNRVLIKSPSGPAWLTLPVHTGGLSQQLISDVRLNTSRPWRTDHLKTIQTNYGKAPGFTRYAGLLDAVYGTAPSDRLIDITAPVITALLAELAIPVPVVLASSLGVSGRRSEMLANLVEAVGGTTYLSGPSGRSYLDETPFQARGIGVAYHSYAHPIYPQRFGAFAPGLSTLDYLMNEPGAQTWRQTLLGGGEVQRV